MVTIESYGEYAQSIEGEVYKIILIGDKLQSPTIEAKIEGTHTVMTNHCDRAIIACPSIIGRNLNNVYMRKVYAFEHINCIFTVIYEKPYLLTMCHKGINEHGVLSESLIEHIIPISIGMRQSQKNWSVALPFSRVPHIFYYLRARFIKFMSSRAVWSERFWQVEEEA